MATRRASAAAPTRTAPAPRSRDGYARLSTRPLHVLVFLLPMMILYELGSVRYLSDPGRGVFETIGARKILTDFFNAFGVAGYFLPPLVLSSVLLTWHVLERDRWRVRQTLSFATEKLANEHGWFYHFVNAKDGQRAGRSEASTIDTALFMQGAVFAREYFHDDSYPPPGARPEPPKDESLATRRPAKRARL